MGTVNIAELKNRLSAYLCRVRAGEELLVRDRNLPIARIVPLTGNSADADEAALVANGHLRLPQKQFDPAHFWTIGGSARGSRRLKAAIESAFQAEREEDNARLLGRKRGRPRLHPRSIE